MSKETGQEQTKSQEIVGKYSCPHCRQLLAAPLSGWNESKYIRCPNPKCGKYHFVPPVSLRNSQRPSEMAYLVICPKCYEITNIPCSENTKEAKCPNCSAPVWVTPINQQIKFAASYYSKDDKLLSLDSSSPDEGIRRDKLETNDDTAPCNWKGIVKAPNPIGCGSFAFSI